MIKFNQQYMNETLDAMLTENEQSLCPVYCVFKPSGFIGSRGSIMGYVSLTNAGRMLIVQSIMGKTFTTSAMLLSLQKLKISKNLFGQTVVDAVFLDGKGDFRLKFQIAPKVVGCNFPHQEENLNKMLYVLSSFEERCNSQNK